MLAVFAERARQVFLPAGTFVLTQTTRKIDQATHALCLTHVASAIRHGDETTVRSARHDHMPGVDERLLLHVSHRGGHVARLRETVGFDVATVAGILAARFRKTSAIRHDNHITVTHELAGKRERTCARLVMRVAGALAVIEDTT